MRSPRLPGKTGREILIEGTVWLGLSEETCFKLLNQFGDFDENTPLNVELIVNNGDCQGASSLSLAGILDCLTSALTSNKDETATPTPPLKESVSEQLFVVKRIGVIGKLLGKNSVAMIASKLRELQEGWEISLVPTALLEINDNIFIIQPQLRRNIILSQDALAEISLLANRYVEVAQQIYTKLHVQLDFIGTAGIICWLRGSCKSIQEILLLMSNLGLDANNAIMFFDPIAWIFEGPNKIFQPLGLFAIYVQKFILRQVQTNFEQQLGK